MCSVWIQWEEKTGRKLSETVGKWRKIVGENKVVLKDEKGE